MPLALDDFDSNWCNCQQKIHSNSGSDTESHTFVNMFGEEEAILTAARRSTPYPSRMKDCDLCRQ
jgi:hypothetical protein